MDERLEKLYSQVLVTWLNLNCCARDDKEHSQLFKYAALQLEHCLKSAGFETDIPDFVKELGDIA